MATPDDANKAKKTRDKMIEALQQAIARTKQKLAAATRPAARTTYRIELLELQNALTRLQVAALKDKAIDARVTGLTTDELNRLRIIYQDVAAAAGAEQRVRFTLQWINDFIGIVT